MTHKKLKPSVSQSRGAAKPAAPARAPVRESNLEVVPVDPAVLEKVREVLKRRGFSQYQK